jgi:hypothetical protein
VFLLHSQQSIITSVLCRDLIKFEYFKFRIIKALPLGWAALHCVFIPVAEKGPLNYTFNATTVSTSLILAQCRILRAADLHEKSCRGCACKRTMQPSRFRSSASLHAPCTEARLCRSITRHLNHKRRKMGSHLQNLLARYQVQWSAYKST